MSRPPSPAFAFFEFSAAIFGALECILSSPRFVLPVLLCLCGSSSRPPRPPRRIRRLHFCVLLAGVQIPARFEWKRELAVLSPMNRKLFWVYLGFIGGTIAAFGVLTLALRGEMLRGDRSALALAALLATWWTARILIDALVFDHRDWPKGAQFVAGHVLLTSTFVAMAFSYWTLLVSSWLR